MVVMTDDLELRKEVLEGLKKNDGYCPCAVGKNDDTKCKCKEFRDMIKGDEFGECRCGLWINR